MQETFGTLFPEGILKGKKKSFHHKEEKDVHLFPRLILMVVFLILAVGILATRLFELDIIKGSYYRKLAAGNRIREKKIVAPRGIIYDRNGKPLVHNIPQGVSIGREYIYGESFAHVLGYMGEIDSKELQQINSSLPESLSYKAGDMIGKSGIEKFYEERIRGIDGKELTEVDAKGEFIRNLGRVDPVAGSNIHLSLDLSLQRVASLVMEGRKGAVIASIPTTGEVLVLYSSPSFDPNAFIKGVNVESILTDVSLPLFNRAIGGIYPPGSIFKIITAIAGLETLAVKPETQYEDVGVLEVGSFRFPNWYFLQYGKKDGMVDIVKGLKRSNDIYFYRVGEELGIDRLALWARKMGVGSRLGIDIEGEEEGVMPDSEWKKENRGEQWYLGDTYHVAIGQGDVLTTPLQVNSWTNVVGNEGRLCKPHIAQVQSSKFKVQNENCKDLGIKKETIELVKKGMIEACMPGGTGWPLFKFKIQNSKLKIDNVNFLETFESTTSAKKMTEIVTACKTGTAEFGDPQNHTHAWFSVFAPAYKPEISISVLVEGAGEGSSVAAPIAKKILEEWFQNK